MKTESRAIEWIVWFALGGVILAITVAFVQTEVKRRTHSSGLPIYGSLPSFALTNQLGEAVSLDSLKGKVWISDVIFTRCPGPCAQMTQKMEELQKDLPEGPVKLVSVTTDPEFDQPSVLKRYAKRFGADNRRWHFLTGPPADVRHFITNSLRQVSIAKGEDERDSPNDLFIHSTLFVLVDQQGRIRKTFEGLQPETHTNLLQAVEALLKEGS